MITKLSFCVVYELFLGGGGGVGWEVAVEKHLK